MRSPLLILCMLAFADAFGQEKNTHMALVRKVDAMRLPAGDFSARVTVREGKAGAPDAAESVFRQFSRVRHDATGRPFIDTLLVCDAPARDAGKLILFSGSGCWLQTPKAARPARISAQQIATHALLVDWMSWRFADDFDHTCAGTDTVAASGGNHLCTVLDLTPKQGVKNRANFMRCWVDSSGRLWKADIYSASRRLLRSVEIGRYEMLLGEERACRMRIEASGKTEEVLLDGVKRQNNPDDYFEPARLPVLRAVFAESAQRP